MDGPEATRLEVKKEYPPPRRPASWEALKFKPQPAVQWFAPNVLADAALRVLISSGFGAFLDKRELQASVATRPTKPKTVDPDKPAEPEPRDWTQATDVWLDFIADTGDGFAATYTVAWLASQSPLKLANYGELPRAGLMILGGDEVYPVGDADAYENRFTRPYEASLPYLRTGNPELYAIPGNHDWYDGLTSFFRVFCQRKWIGGRKTHQTRSYFAIPLPQRWWIWGIDIQLDSYMDQPQQDYFNALDLQPGDKVILCTGIPSWYEGKLSRSYKNLAFVERTLINDRKARLVLSLSGDHHHYTRYVGQTDGTHKVTSGGGGAFSHPTHMLEKALTLPLGADDRDQTFVRAGCYPDFWTSWRRTWRAVALLPYRNPTFMGVTAVLYLMLGWSSQFTLRTGAAPRAEPTTATTIATTGTTTTTLAPDLDDTVVRAGWKQVSLGLFGNPVSVIIIVVFLIALIAFAKPKKTLSKRVRAILRWPMGIAHLAMHVTAFVLLALAAVEVVSWWFDGGFWFTFFLLVVMGVLGGVVGAIVMGLYLAVTCALLGAHGNEAFSAMRLTGFKNFLRLHLDEGGRLTVYAIGIDKALRRAKWKVDSGGAPEQPWIVPEEGAAPVAHLIEEFVVDPTSPTP